jgi:hypothetical protein
MACISLRRELHSHPDARRDTGALRNLGDERELGGFLDDEDDGAAELRKGERGLDVLLILVAIAHDEGVLVVEQCHHREQLRLATRLEPVGVLATRVDDRLDDVAVLVHLDGVDALVGAFVSVLADGLLEALVEMHDPVAEHIGEPDQQGRADAAAANLVDELLEIHTAACGSLGMHRDVAALVHAEVVAAPVPDSVRLDRIGEGPSRLRGTVRHPGNSCEETRP